MTTRFANGVVSLCSVLADDLTARPSDVRATGCTSDVRRVHPGDVFVCLTDAESDGHDVATDAVERGAAAVVCERCLPIFTVPQFVVSNSRAAYGRLCQALVGKPSREIKVIGVTGTNGKTTVVRLLASILRTAGFEVGTIDSLGNFDGARCLPALDGEMTQPWLARRLAEMSANGLTHAVVEVSSRELCQSVLAGVELDAVCITNIGRDHLDWHGSVENYRQAKRRILEHLRPEGVAILNADCPDSLRLLDQLAQPALTIGMRKPAGISAQVIEQHAGEQDFLLTAGDDSVGVRTSIVGDHHIYNCLTAAALGLASGIKLTDVARGLQAVDELPGRMERVMCGQGFNVLVDAANSPDTLFAALRAARKVTTGRLICVFGGDGQTDRGQLPAMGRVVGSLAELAVITTNGRRTHGMYDGTRDIVGGFVDPRKAHVILDRTHAISWALEAAEPGDTVMIAGMGQPARTHEQPYDDGDVARQVLHGTFGEEASPRVAA